MIRILIGAVSCDGRVDANVVSSYPGNQGSFRGNGPSFNVRFQKISIVSDETGCTVVAPQSKNSAAQISAAMCTAKVEGE